MATKTTHVVRINAGVDMAHNAHTHGNTESYTTQLTPKWLKYGGLLINGLVEQYEDPQTGKPGRRWIPRPILTSPATASDWVPLNTGGNIRGLYNFSYRDIVITYITRESPNLGELVAVTAGRGLESGAATAMITGQATNSSLELGGTEYWDGTNRYFVASIGEVRPWYVTSVAAATQIADTDCPSGVTTSPHIAYMDGALFIAKDNSIHNSEFASITNWPGYSRNKEQYPEIISALVKHGNSIVAFSDNSTEFFFNAGYSGTSPLQRQESFATRIGLVRTTGLPSSPWRQYKTFTEHANNIYFVGRESDGASRNLVSVYKMENYRITKISTPYIDKILSFACIPNAAAWGLGPLTIARTPGNTVVCLSIRTDSSEVETIEQSTKMEFTLVYSIESKTWGVWTARNPTSLTTKSFNLGETAGTNYSKVFPLEYMVSTNGYHSIGFHPDTLECYHLQSPEMPTTITTTGGSVSAPAYNDYDSATSPVDFLIRYPTLDFGSMKEKSISKAFMVGLQNLDSGTPADINTYVFNSVYKESTGAYPNALATKSYDDSMLTNLSTGRKFIIEQQWSGNAVAGIESLELHVVEGEN